MTAEAGADAARHARSATIVPRTAGLAVVYLLRMGVAEAPALSPPGGRLQSLDAYRGFVMLVLASGPTIAGIASALGEDGFFALVARQLNHVEWEGCSFWDLIMPSFMLMVGASLPYSCASREARGQSRTRIRLHVLYRSLVFVLLGLLISSRGYSYTRFTFTGLLTQFGLAYPWAYLLVGRGRRVQLLISILILCASWLAFVLYPAPPEGFDFAAVGLPDHVEPFSGLFGHWNRGTNVAAAFDTWFLNLFPRPELFRFDPAGNQTLNFVPSIVTMTLGVMVGEFLRGGRSTQQKLWGLGAGGVLLLAVGMASGLTLCPIVKSLWTPSYVLFAGGWTLLFLAAFFWSVDMRGHTKLAFPLVVVGMNPLAMYCMTIFTGPWLHEQISIHLVPNSWTVQNLLVILVHWLICLWMYRRRIFPRV